MWNKNLPKLAGFVTPSAGQLLRTFETRNIVYCHWQFLLDKLFFTPLNGMVKKTERKLCLGMADL